MYKENIMIMDHPNMTTLCFKHNATLVNLLTKAIIES